MADKKSKKKPTLKDQISDLNNQVNDEKDKFLRLFAEFENYRKRVSSLTFSMEQLKKLPMKKNKIEE